MHQHPRAPPRGASPASSAQTNPTRTNNPRDPGNAPSLPRPGSSASGHARRDSVGHPISPDGANSRPPLESVKKLDQILQVCPLPICEQMLSPSLPAMGPFWPRASGLGTTPLTMFILVSQNFYLKAAALILESRMSLHYTSSSKMSKWVRATAPLLPGEPISDPPLTHVFRLHFPFPGIPFTLPRLVTLTKCAVPNRNAGF